ncbi:Armadillo-type fold [Pseudocohnilembus persalinus]|uniref:Armadillo-type fold n=1 Tax=Pseudocohnilembus persalinus TaxID=266149 RepID=A0A0V0Q9P0_PSEPJ|nr:Armadillo-type fold [Pseudocohnilembus persalinus]|eukprot:KRW98942.1 Armadillo-type fold [Pseudocohnilembus persalinus]
MRTQEDLELKENIEKNIEMILGNDQEKAKTGLETLTNIVSSATSTMTSIPKPFKFLKDHYTSLVTKYESTQPSYYKKLLADFLSVLSMTMAEPGQQKSLQFLKAGTMKDYKKWGFEYLQSLVRDICEEYDKRLEAEQGTDDLLELVNDLVPYFMKNNAEHDAIDLLIEVEKPEELINYVTIENFKRVIEYIQACSVYVSHVDEQESILETGFKIAFKLKQYASALKLAIKLNKEDLIKKVFDDCEDLIVKKQLAFQLARQRIVIEDLDDDINEIACNTYLSQYYVKLAKDLSLLKPKSPEQIYKSHLTTQTKNYGSDNVDSLKNNLADTYVNALINAGLQNDSLIIQTEEDQEKSKQDWFHKVKGNALTAATASVGLVTMWEPDNGSEEINKFIDVKDGYMKEGACIGLGICNQGMPSDTDPAFALLSEHIEGNDGKDIYSKRGAIIGLGIAYAGSNRENIQELLTPIAIDVTENLELAAYAALSLGLVFVGSCNGEISETIWQALCEVGNDEKLAEHTLTRFFAVALGLLFLGQQEKCEDTLQILESIESDHLKRYCSVCIEGCAFVGSGNVLKIQEMLKLITEGQKEMAEMQKKEEEKLKEEQKNQQQNQQTNQAQMQEKEKRIKEKIARQSQYLQVAVIAIALIASSEEIGRQMAIRTYNNILQFCDITVKRAVPIALGILHISDPKIQIMDMLVKLSHDDDETMSQNAIISLGLIGAGTNNSRLSDLLRNEFSYYKKESNQYFLFKIAQGFLHLGKGMLTLQPYYSDKFLYSKTAMAGIITFAHSCIDLKNIILDKYHYNIFYLSISMYPKFLFTLDENLENYPTTVRVGQAVDYVGTSGNAKKITGFQTHTSPVIINHGERAEFNTNEYIGVQDCVLENFIIVKKNPDYVQEEEVPKKKQSFNL